MGVRRRSASSVRGQPTCSRGSWNGSQSRRGRPNRAEKQPRWRPYRDQPVQIRDQGPFEHWQEEILNYFEARQTSGPVEGVNNKARVILKRAYGLKSAESLWTRLILDLNRAKEIVLYTIRQIRDLVRGFRALFACT